MPKSITRRSLLVASAATLAASPSLLMGAMSRQAQPNTDRQLPAELVFKFVRGAHTNLERTTQLLAEEPRLLRASWEWSPGDFESALDAAAHTGSIEIVEFLIGKGAPYNIFAAAVLGDLTHVESACKKYPELLQARGPHGITLHEHAVAGGELAVEVREFLEEQGAPEAEPPLNLEIDSDLASRVAGKFQIQADGRTLTLTIAIRDQQLWLSAPGRDETRLLYQGQDRFVLEGTPAELLFEPDYDSALLREGRPIGFIKRIVEH